MGAKRDPDCRSPAQAGVGERSVRMGCGILTSRPATATHMSLYLRVNRELSAPRSRASPVSSVHPCIAATQDLPGDPAPGLLTRIAVGGPVGSGL